jgi:hypothetical protein
VLPLDKPHHGITLDDQYLRPSNRLGREDVPDAHF